MTRLSRCTKEDPSLSTSLASAYLIDSWTGTKNKSFGRLMRFRAYRDTQVLLLERSALSQHTARCLWSW